MALKVLNTDDEVTKELKEAVIKVFVAAGSVVRECRLVDDRSEVSRSS